MEDDAFKGFLKDLGFAKLRDYEETWAQGSAKDRSERQVFLEQQIAQMQKEVQFIENSQTHKNVQAMQ